MVRRIFTRKIINIELWRMGKYRIAGNLMIEYYTLLLVDDLFLLELSFQCNVVRLREVFFVGHYRKLSWKQENIEQCRTNVKRIRR